MAGASSASPWALEALVAAPAAHDTPTQGLMSSLATAASESCAAPLAEPSRRSAIVAAASTGVAGAALPRPPPPDEGRHPAPPVARKLDATTLPSPPSSQEMTRLRDGADDAGLAALDSPMEEEEEEVECEPLPPPGFPSPPHPSTATFLARGRSTGQGLPIAPLREELLEKVESHRVVVIDAATGSGKSTMVPVYLAEQCVASGRSCRILVTQPRRLAAKLLAKHVSESAGAGVGDLAGYRVGSDKKDNNAPIVYVTVGHILEALVHNPGHLARFSHFVIDEAHERSVEADFFMALLRMLLSRPKTLSTRVVVMSATLQAALGDFFVPLLLPAPARASVGHLSLPGKTNFPVTDMAWDDIEKTWPGVFRGLPTPNFSDVSPSRDKQPKRRSDDLTKLCKAMSPFCARLVFHLRDMGHRIALVFLPGLDQMREVEKAIEAEGYRGRGAPKVYLVHSALEEDTYREALQQAPPDDWRVVLSTNIAESSLTVPGVDTVIDFGLHRVNLYDDWTRMSLLCTEWCCKASMKQRRGRTGRTNPGLYVRLVPDAVYDPLPDFDASGVERSPLTRVTLEAAHLAQLLASPPEVRAGLPVTVSEEGCGTVAFWDGPRDGWRIRLNGGAEGGRTFPESSVHTLPMQASHILALLPSPPALQRVRFALAELHELGALTPEDTPTVLGAAFLKVPLDVPLARFVVLGWSLGSPVEAAVLAGAMSLPRSCDVFRTPFNSQNRLSPNELRLLEEAIRTRREFDRGTHSEPITVYNLFMEWMRLEGGRLGEAPRTAKWSWIVHGRIWSQFVLKVVDICLALRRLVPEDSQEAADLDALLRRARYGGSQPYEPPQERPQWLAALLAWGLAPSGFVAVGQTPALYDNSDGGMNVFSEVVTRNGGDAISTLCWSKAVVSDVQQVVRSVIGRPAEWTQTAGPGGDVLVGLEASSPARLPESAELLCRLCGPFNGKETEVAGVPVRPPRHPCMLNWYMPRRGGGGPREVRVSWKSQLETMVHIPQRGERGARCRPKRLLVAAGGDEIFSASGRTVHLRCATLLPVDDGGRSALLWLLASGMPGVEESVVLVAPTRPDVCPRDFEIRAVRLWRYTLCFRPGDYITSADLQAVNAFRVALLGMQRHRPHRLSGRWVRRVVGVEVEYVVECVAPSTQGSEEILAVVRAKQGATSTDGAGLSQLDASPELEPEFELHRCRGSVQWRLLRQHTEVATAQERNDRGTQLHMSDGSVWTLRHHGGDGTPLLAQLGGARDDFRRAAQEVFSMTDGRQRLTAGAAPLGRRHGALARLAPLIAPAAHGEGCPNLAPFDLDALSASVARFGAQMTGDGAIDRGEAHEEDMEDEMAEDAFDDASLDISQEARDDEFMWHLAEEANFSLENARMINLVESAIALPREPVCAECGEEGKPFSKTQLRQHADRRTCKDCLERGNRPASSGSPPQRPPASAATAAAPPVEVTRCCACNVELSRENCSASQRQKHSKARRCLQCVNGNGVGSSADA